MAYTAFVTRIKNLHKHPNADRLQIGECFGNSVVVSLDYENNQLGVYFPCDGRLSFEFANANNLLRKKDENGVNVGGYMDTDKRNVTAVRLRGEKSDGLFLPLKCLEQFGDIATLKEGDRIDTWNGHLICEKYVPRRNPSRNSHAGGNRTNKKKVPIAPLFAEHADTEQLAYNLSAFKPGDEIEITLKMHGTSQRTGYLPVVNRNKVEYDAVWKLFIDALIPVKSWKNKFKAKFGKPVYDWGYVSGTRRTVLEDYEGGYYGSDEFREKHSKSFEGKLWKGETVYYEVVGFITNGTPIMANCNNKKLNDKEFIKQYGETTTFSYGCFPTVKYKHYPDRDGYDMNSEPIFKQSNMYVYRMTMTNPNGEVVEYTPDFMRYRCEQMGVKTVPIFAKGHICIDGSVSWVNMVTGEDMTTAIGDEVRENDPYSFEFNPGDSIKAVAEQFYDGPDPVGKTHIREGVVVRILNRPKFTAYKHKNFSFKVLEGIVKAEAVEPDMEEAESIAEEI